jgi:two-component system chemotaxis response regulator CheB
MTPLVVVGTSLGGLDASRTLLRELRADCPAAVAIAQHRMARADGTLVELLARDCALPVCEPCDRDPIEAGRVYVAPSDYHLLVDAGCFSLSIDPPVHFARPSIDVLFQSAADAYRSELIAFVLTGSSHDGALGAAAVKRAGGRVYVEDPSSAHSSIAPEATLAATEVDAVLPIEALAKLLAALSDERSSLKLSVNQRA